VSHILVEDFLEHYGVKTDTIDSFVGHYEDIVITEFETGDRGSASMWSGKVYCQSILRDVGTERMRVSDD
jgi:hypothetical protein